MEVVAVNDSASFETIAYLLNHDTEHGTWGNGKVVSFEGDSLIMSDRCIPTFSEQEAGNLPWESLTVDLVLDCSGAYTSRSKAKSHLLAGAKKVLVSAAAGTDVPTIICGINEQKLQDSDRIVSAASCSTVGLAPLVKALNEYTHIIRGFCTTIHAFTPTQMVLDNPQPKGNLRRSRTAGTNIIPTSAAAAQALGLVLPELAGKLQGSAIRVPVTKGSLITFFACVKTLDLTVEGVNTAMKLAQSDIFGYTDEELVSSDIAGTHFASIFDATLTKVDRIGKEKHIVEVAAWFDNETSYVSQYVKLAALM
jgi:glyceraldehyde 3-phosphate dehydrogenase